jgi:hypothetical protein
VSLRDEPEEVVVRVTDDRAIVIGAPSETKRSRWGRWVADLTPRELASLLRTLDPAMRAFIESQRLTGRLVELDRTSRAMWSTAEMIIEEDGWIQATLRNRGQFTRLMRIRPATGIAAMAGGVAIVGAIAAQAQAAEMARDIKAIRQRVDEIYKHLQSDQIGAVENAVEQVDDLVERLRDHGKDGVEASEIPIIRNALGDSTRKCMGHLKDAVTKLENANQESPRQAEKGVSKEAVEDVMLYLGLLEKLHAAKIQLELAQIALDYHEGKLDVVRTRTARFTKSTDEFRAEIEGVLGRLGQLDQNIRARFGSRWKDAIWLPASGLAGTAARAVVDEVAGTKVIRVRLPGASIPIPAKAIAAVGGALVPLGVGGVNAVVQRRAENKLDERLVQLTRASSKSSETMTQATESLEVLRTLTEELAGTGE